MADAGIRFMVADCSHDAGIRALLRESSMAGDVALSLRTEPSYFDAAAAEGGEHHAVVAIEGERVVCVGGVSVRERYINGTPRRVGYLGRLRLAASHAGRFDVLRRGYAYFGELQRTLSLAGCFTSIASENARARRLLERGVAGLPAYHFAAELVTSVFCPHPQSFCFGGVASSKVRRRLRDQGIAVRHGAKAFRDAVVALCERHGPTYQFMPRWTRNELDHVIDHYGLSDNHFRVLLVEGGPVGCAAIWDQRRFRQTVVAGYAPRVARWRTLHNLLVGLRHRGVALPEAGSTLAQAFVSHLALPADQPMLLNELILLLSATGHTMRAGMLAIGLDARDPRLSLLQSQFHPYVYRTRLYTVHWPDEPASVVPDGRLLYPEIALL